MKALERVRIKASNFRWVMRWSALESPCLEHRLSLNASMAPLLRVPEKACSTRNWDNAGLAENLTSTMRHLFRDGRWVLAATRHGSGLWVIGAWVAHETMTFRFLGAFFVSANPPRGWNSAMPRGLPRVQGKKGAGSPPLEVHQSQSPNSVLETEHREVVPPQVQQSSHAGPSSKRHFRFRTSEISAPGFRRDPSPTFRSRFGGFRRFKPALTPNMPI